MAWFLQISNNAPIAFSDLGLSGLKRTVRSQQAGTFSFAADGALCDSDPLLNGAHPVAEGTICTVLAGVDVAAVLTPWFSGRLQRIPRQGTGSRESVSYELLDAWRDFERNVYQQQWNVITGVDENGNPTTAAQYRSECILGMDLNGAQLTSAQVITQIVEWAITVGANCKVGTILDASAPYVPFDEVSDLPCSECIRKMMRWTPDAVAWFDYSQRPPAFNVTRRGACAPVELPLTGNTETLEIKALPDLLAPSVVIRYVAENEVDGKVAGITVTPDVWPPGATGEEYGALVMTVRLAGSNAAFQKQPVTVKPIPQDENASNAVSWLQANIAWLANFSADRLTVRSLTGIVAPGETDTSGNPVDDVFGDYPNQLTSGTTAAWMGVQSAKVTVTAVISYNYPDEPDEESESALAVFGPDNGGDGDQLTENVTVTGTDAVTQVYQQLSSYAQAEPAPTGLAEYLYGSLSTLAYEGSYTLVAQEVGSWHLGLVLNIAGGRPEWVGMNALLQEIEDDLDAGRTRLKFGAGGHLTVRDIMEYLRASRSRTESRHIKERQSGQPGDAAAVDGPEHSPEVRNDPLPSARVSYPWIEYVDDQDDASGRGATWDALMGYGGSSFAGEDEIDHSGPLECLEVSVGNDGSGWSVYQLNATDLSNVFSMITGDQTPANDRLWIGRTNGDAGGSVLVTPFDPSVKLSINLNPAEDGSGDPYIHLSLADMLVEMQDENASQISLDLSSAPIVNITNPSTGNMSSLDENSVNLSDSGTGGTVTMDASATMGKAVSFQEVEICINGMIYHAIVLMSAPY